ncbi:unnamed protein product [Effrenium voratum]|uniref:Uncharacterized protein n=1 Tax=Effrenium voratum TaxID=2562239 RepID=A0AA36HMH6_9DINO|nr:unnamed protein product [Effrenium voratum]
MAQPPPLLASLALGLAHLGLRAPEPFRVIAQLARRGGLWSFADAEAAALLEGFSRARRCDEVLFQEGGRLIMARMDRMEPRLLTTMMTAFACANIATETLFFAVGDTVLRREREGGFTLRHLAELADAFARVRARHPLLLDLVPSRCEKPVSSVEALVQLFSAYVDARQGFGPAELRERLLAQLLRRELSAAQIRRLLQAAARARWPSHSLLELAASVRDTSEVDAVFDCFLQLRVTPPDDFPISEEKRRHREDRLQARQARQQRRKEKESDQKGEKEEPLPSLRSCQLRVEPDLGAGLELEVCGAGYVVDDCQHAQDLKPGDVIVAIAGRLLVGLDEDQVEEHFGAAFCDGAPLLVGSFDQLQHFSLESIRTAALAIPVPEPQEPPLPKPVAEIQSELAATRPTQPIGTSEPEIDRGNPTVATSTEPPETKRSSNSVQAEQRHEAKSYQPRSGKGNGKGQRVWRPKAS